MIAEAATCRCSQGKESKKRGRERGGRGRREQDEKGRVSREKCQSVDRSKEEIEDLYGSLTFRTVHVSDPVSQLFLRQRFVYVPEVSSGKLRRGLYFLVVPFRAVFVFALAVLFFR